MTSTDWILAAVLLAVLLYIIIGSFHSPQPNEINLAIGFFMLIVAGCCFASGHIPTPYRDAIDRTANPVFFWLFIMVCSGSGLIHIAKFFFRGLASPRR